MPSSIYLRKTWSIGTDKGQLSTSRPTEGASGYATRCQKDGAFDFSPSNRRGDYSRSPRGALRNGLLICGSESVLWTAAVGGGLTHWGRIVNGFSEVTRDE